MKPYLAYLELEVNSPNLSREWVDQARTLGFDVRACSGHSVAEIDLFLAEAVGLLIFDTTFIHFPESADRIADVIRTGKRALVLVSVNDIEISNYFLDKFGIEATRIGIDDVRAVQDAAPFHGAITLGRADGARHFGPPELLHGVNDIVAYQARALRIDDRALPLLCAPLASSLIVDRSTDFEIEWPLSVVPFAAISDPEHEQRGGIIVVSASVWNDPYTGALGHHFDGIAAADNRTFTKNLLEWTVGLRIPAIDHSTDAYAIIHGIERALLGLVISTLSSAWPSDWWRSLIPDDIRVRCERLWAKEHSQLAQTAYLELTDLPRIIRHSPSPFASICSRVSWLALDEIESSFNMLNELQVRMANPSKILASGMVVTEVEVTRLRNYYADLEAGIQNSA